MFPCVQVHLDRIAHNMEILVNYYSQKGIKITPVTKGVGGSVEIAKLFTNFDIHSIGDSHLQNIQKMKEGGVTGRFMLLRSPMLSESEAVVVNADISLNSEMVVIQTLDKYAAQYEKKHEILLMIELGDLREGILPKKNHEYIENILKLRNIKLAGIGTNLTCLNGIKPTIEKMDQLNDIARQIQDEFDIRLDIVSGGNSANYQWSREVSRGGAINHLRVGESILLGTDPISQGKIPDLYDNNFLLQIEVIESKRKPSMPTGTVTYNAFGEKPIILDEGEMNRAICAIGQQDLDMKGCSPLDENTRIIGVTSDHLIINSKEKTLKVGDIIDFRITYRALLRLMISPYVEIKYIP